MKIKIKTLAKFGVIVAALEFALDMGKACMFKGFEVSHPEAAEDMLKFMDECIKRKDLVPITRRLKIKWVKKLCKFI